MFKRANYFEQYQARIVATVKTDLRKIFHPLWRCLPRASRQRLYSIVTGLNVTEASAHAPPIRAPWTVIGALRSPTGLGQAARLAVRALQMTGEPVSAVDISANLLQPVTEPTLDLPLPQSGPGTLLIFVNPPNIPAALSALSRSTLADKHRLICMVWEHFALPRIWLKQVNYGHSFAAPSRFSASLISNSIKRPVRILPHPIAVDDWSVVPKKSPGATFRIGTAFDLGSTIARKNPFAAIEAFRIAAAQVPGLELYVKLRGGSAEPSSVAKLRALANEVPFKLLEGDWRFAQYQEWISSLDLAISLHRAEGFGLFVAEAMLAGVPAVSTNWSATAEYIDETVGYPVDAALRPANDDTGRYQSHNAVWADVDPNDAARRVVEAVSDTAGRSARSGAGRARALRAFSAAAFVDALREPVT